MKKKLNNKGFALVETLVCALFVVVIFVVIFENYLPIMAKYNRSEKYDDLDSKYLAFYVKAFIETDKPAIINSIHNKLPSNKYLYTFEPCTVEKCLSLNPVPEDITEINNSTGGAFELCTMLSSENRQKCQDFIDKSNITRVYLTQYETTDLKDKVKNPDEAAKIDELKNISYPLQLYIDNIPTYEATARDKTGYKRLIIEIKNERSKTYYSYANIELRPTK